MKKTILVIACFLSFKIYAADVTLNSIGQIPPNLIASLDGLVVDVNSGDLGNSDTSYFYFDLIKAGFNAFSMSYVITNTTLSVEYSNDLPSVSSASAIWTPVSIRTQFFYEDSAGVAVTTNTTGTIIRSGTLTAGAPLPWSRVRIKRLTTSGTNALEIRLSRMRLN